MWERLVELLGEVSAASPDTLPAGEVVGQLVTIALRCVFVVGGVYWTLAVGCNATVSNSSHLRHDTEDSGSNRYRDAVLTRTVIYLVCRTVTRCWNAVDDGDAVFVVRWMLVTLVPNLDITIQEREFEGFVLGTFENTICRVETIE